MKKSIVKWQTGLPKQSDFYLTTTTAGEVRTRVWYDSGWLNDGGDDEVVAWCKLSDIEPYKE